MTVYVGRRWKREDETDIITPGTKRHLWYISCSKLKELKESPGVQKGNGRKGDTDFDEV